ncbi:MAG: hypothetical protein Q7S22_05115 [Candidatus Micrarchaeota archaeon]|nr:hypothetical protein [Candidatus Micrarchaeota archaeon]
MSISQRVGRTDSIVRNYTNGRVMAFTTNGTARRAGDIVCLRARQAFQSVVVPEMGPEIARRIGADSVIVSANRRATKTFKVVKGTLVESCMAEDIIIALMVAKLLN